MKSEERREVFRSVFNSTVGKKALNEILNHCRVGKSPFHPESERATCKMIGAQEVGQWLADQLKED